MIIKLGAIGLISALGLTLFSVQSGSGVMSADSRKTAAAPAPIAPAPGKPAIIPERLLDCTLGRITNFDPTREQAASEYVFAGRHKFRLFLPAAPARTMPPPDPTDTPEPVDPRTRIVADPDGLANDSKAMPFDRVVDLWPGRVEMTKPINNVAVTLIMVDGFDQARSAATLFLTKANDAVTFDLENLYYGQCGVTLGASDDILRPDKPRSAPKK